jgi:hypothetical protein
MAHTIMHADTPSPYPLPPPKKLFIHTAKPTPAQEAEAKALGIPIVSSSELETVCRVCEKNKFSPDGVCAHSAFAKFQAEEQQHKHERRAACIASASPEHVAAFIAHTASAHRMNRCMDAVHYAQKEHQSTLWRASDALVLRAIGVSP